MRKARTLNSARVLGTMFRQIVILAGLIGVLVPFIFLFLNSIKPEYEFLATPITLLPSRIHFDYYLSLFTEGSKTLQTMQNSLIVTATTTVLAILAGALAGFSLARLRISSKLIGLLIFIILLVRFYPKITTVIPYFIMMRNLRLLDTLPAIIIAHTSITLPFVVLVMMSFFRDIPTEVEESALIDGCSLWKVFYRISLPLAKPGIATSALLTAIISWNEFLMASAVSAVKATTLPIAVSSFITDKGIYWGPMSAMTFLLVLPIVIFTLFLQRYLIRGLTLGSIK